MMQWVRKIWNDNVFGKVIASLIFLGITSVSFTALKDFFFCSKKSYIQFSFFELIISIFVILLLLLLFFFLISRFRNNSTNTNVTEKKNQNSDVTADYLLGKILEREKKFDQSNKEKETVTKEYVDEKFRINIEHIERLTKSSREELYNFLSNALAELKPIESFLVQAEVHRQEAKIIIEKNNSKSGCTSILIIISIVWFATLVLLKGFRLTEFLSFPFPFPLANLLLDIVMILPIFFLIPTKRYKNEVVEKTKAALFDKEAKEKYKNSIYLPAIPKEYYYSLALETMLEILENGKANTWRELVNRYEEQLHRWRMQEYDRQRLELQMHQAKIAEIPLRQVRHAKNLATIGAEVNLRNK